MVLRHQNTEGRSGTKQKLLRPSSVISQTNKIIAAILAGKLPILRDIAHYVTTSGGKRIRPLFAYYLGKAYGVDGTEMLRLGALLEVVHAASLLHDDVVDAADERRSRPSGAKLFGNKQVVLSGDHLLSSGLGFLNSLQNPKYMAVFTDAIKALSAAELVQMQNHFNLKTTAQVHNSIIDGKTAILFRAAGALVAILRGELNYYQASPAKLGLEFGRFFQERDDFLDYFDAARLQKKGLQDFTNGIVTAPLIYLLKDAKPAEKRLVQQQWYEAEQTGKLAAPQIISDLMEKYTIRQRLSVELERKHSRIIHELGCLPEKKPSEIISREFQKILAVRAA